MSISKKDLSNSLKKDTDLSMRDASIFIDNFFKILSESFQKNEEVKISGFGSFKIFSTKSILFYSYESFNNRAIIIKIQLNIFNIF